MTSCGNWGCGAGCRGNVCGRLCHFKFLSKAATAKSKPQKVLPGEELDTTKNTSNPDSPPKRAFVDMDMEGETKNCCFGCNYKWTCVVCG